MTIESKTTIKTRKQAIERANYLAYKSESSSENNKKIDEELKNLFADFHLTWKEIKDKKELTTPTYNTNQVTDQEIEQATKVNIVELAKSHGIDLEKTSANEYRLADDHSVVINDKKNIFKDFSSTKKAGNPINFVQEYLGTENFVDAVRYLDGVDIEKIDPLTKEKQSEEFHYDRSREVDSFSPSKEYLTRERKINPMLVRYLKEKGYLAQNEFQTEKMKTANIPPHQNLVMKWNYDGKTVGATEQGVHANALYKRNAWKGIQEHSKTDHGFNFMVGEPKNIYFFESGIDAMSFATLKMREEKKGISSLKGSWFVSMEGLKQNTIVPHIKMAFDKLNEGQGDTEQERTPNVFICVDNDQPANEFYEALPYAKESMPRLSPECPYEGEENEKWDWNDELKETTEEDNIIRRIQAKKFQAMDMER